MPSRPYRNGVRKIWRIRTVPDWPNTGLPRRPHPSIIRVDCRPLISTAGSSTVMKPSTVSNSMTSISKAMTRMSRTVLAETPVSAAPIAASGSRKSRKGLSRQMHSTGDPSMKPWRPLAAIAGSTIWKRSSKPMPSATCTAWTRFPVEQPSPGRWKPGRKES